MIDVDTQINAVARTVGSRTWQAGEARTITISQRYDTDPVDLWDAVTNPERIPRWFLPISGELKLGGRFQFEGQAGGIIEECDPPTSFTSTWEAMGARTWIQVRVSPDADGSRLEIEHIGLENEDHWPQYGPGAVGIGWDGALVGLTLHLDSGAAVDKEQAASWTVSDEARRFNALSGERWTQAHIDSGTDDEATAKGMGERATAAYTAVPEA